MALGYLLLILLPVAAVAYIIWDHKRKTAQRLAASADRLQDLLAGTAASPPSRSASKRAGEAPAVPAASLPEARAPGAQRDPAAALYAVRERLLNPPQTLVYHLLRAGLPDYLVFAQMTLASVLEAGQDVPAYAREEALRRLAGRVADFVVADRHVKPVAVVRLNAPAPAGSAPDEGGGLVGEWLATAGVRYVELDPSALPRKDAIRGIVLGAAAATERGKPTPQTAG